MAAQQRAKPPAGSNAAFHELVLWHIRAWAALRGLTADAAFGFLSWRILTPGYKWVSTAGQENKSFSEF